MGRPFASFVFGIASHKVADAMRNAARLAIPTEDLPDGPDDRPGPEETAVACLEAGKYVYCEKPLGITPEQVDRALKAALPKLEAEVAAGRLAPAKAVQKIAEMLGI